MTYWEPESCHQMGQEEYVGISADEVLKRMNEVTNTRTMLELANWLGVRQSVISDAKRRNIIPVAWLRALILNHSDYNPVWVMTGRGDKHW